MNIAIGPLVLRMNRVEVSKIGFVWFFTRGMRNVAKVFVSAKIEQPSVRVESRRRYIFEKALASHIVHHPPADGEVSILAGCEGPREIIFHGPGLEKALGGLHSAVEQQTPQRALSRLPRFSARLRWARQEKSFFSWAASRGIDEWRISRRSNERHQQREMGCTKSLRSMGQSSTHFFCVT